MLIFLSPIHETCKLTHYSFIHPLIQPITNCKRRNQSLHILIYLFPLTNHFTFRSCAYRSCLHYTNVPPTCLMILLHFQLTYKLREQRRSTYMFRFVYYCTEGKDLLLSCYSYRALIVYRWSASSTHLKSVPADPNVQANTSRKTQRYKINFVPGTNNNAHDSFQHEVRTSNRR